MWWETYTGSESLGCTRHVGLHWRCCFEINSTNACMEVHISLSLFFCFSLPLSLSLFLCFSFSLSLSLSLSLYIYIYIYIYVCAVLACKLKSGNNKLFLHHCCYCVWFRHAWNHENFSSLRLRWQWSYHQVMDSLLSDLSLLFLTYSTLPW